jgi:hypothetical protein
MARKHAREGTKAPTICQIARTNPDSPSPTCLRHPGQSALLLNAEPETRGFVPASGTGEVLSRHLKFFVGGEGSPTHESEKIEERVLIFGAGSMAWKSVSSPSPRLNGHLHTPRAPIRRPRPDQSSPSTAGRKCVAGPVVDPVRRGTTETSPRRFSNRPPLAAERFVNVRTTGGRSIEGKILQARSQRPTCFYQLEYPNSVLRRIDAAYVRAIQYLLFWPITRFPMWVQVMQEEN